MLIFLQSFSQKEITANKRITSITLDGKLDEIEWENAKWSSGFSQMRPFPGKAPSKKTQVSMLYDQEASESLDYALSCIERLTKLSATEAELAPIWAEFEKHQLMLAH